MANGPIRHGRATRHRGVTSFVLCAVSLLLGGCSWPEFRWGPEHTGTNSSETMIGVGNVATLHQAWRAHGGEQVSSSPAITGGVVYVGSFDGKLNALSASTGNPLWTAQTNGEIYIQSPAVANGVVYIESSHSLPTDTTHSLLYAFDATGTTNCSGTPKTCAPLWTADLGSKNGLSSPTVANGIVYAGSADGNLYAFNATDGSPLWTGTTGGSILYSSPAVANGIAYVGSSDQHLYAFDAADGTPLWNAPTGGTVSTSSPAVANGVVYIGSNDHKLYAFDAENGSALWTAPTDGLLFSSPAVAKGVVYIGSHSSTTAGTLYAFDAAGTTMCSGTPKVCAPLWTATTGAVIFSSPAVANGVVYIGANGDESAGASSGVFAFDAAGTVNCGGMPKTCTPLWPTTTQSNPVQSSPAVANGRVYIGYDDDSIVAYALPSA
jgi:outer membrane protein assembly factor BamB